MTGLQSYFVFSTILNLLIEQLITILLNASSIHTHFVSFAFINENTSAHRPKSYLRRLKLHRYTIITSHSITYFLKSISKYGVLPSTYFFMCTCLKKSHTWLLMGVSKRFTVTHITYLTFRLLQIIEQFSLLSILSLIFNN